ncbi:MAG: HAMP domain-containing protein [Alphaproteobacteria bacterium]|uniref:histidine kinase n=1 Tax=Candidatus Nitrobium versatile TaxID=2884831 RepID=A0A953JEJ7_9BACT|nr:HAMP domain-containing protein [Candidatus Nitrobium versatile]
MRIGITHRLFFSILAATCLAILCMFLIMQWSITWGFLRYLNTLDQVRVEQIAERLEQAYGEQGGWDFIQEKPKAWMRRLITMPPDDESASQRLKVAGKHGDLPPLPRSPQNMKSTERRLIILDSEQKQLYGARAKAGKVDFKPLSHKGRIIGYLGLLPPKHFLSPQQLQFLKQQKLALVLAAAGVVLTAALFAFPLANRLVRPVRAIATATHELASGTYAIRVPVSSSDELGQLARDFNAMALTLERNEKARRQWVADISHELRTPLAVLQGEIEALLEGIRRTTPETIRSLHTEVLRLHRLVNDLYQLSLSDLGTQTYRKEDLDLVEPLRDSAGIYRAEFVRKGITLTTDISLKNEKVIVFADRERLNQLFGNLLDNSLKYTDSGGELVVSLTCCGNHATIDFQDSAPGVQENELDRLFDRFYRVEGSRSRASGGAGLGLAICRNIIEAHEGTISAHPSPSGGVMIRIILPVAGRCL